ncbi:MAG: DMT family transporter [Chthoniobacterales bacterium]|nr:DMT family transporter [Chthoniobacterales bacterium]
MRHARSVAAIQRAGKPLDGLHSPRGIRVSVSGEHESIYDRRNLGGNWPSALALFTYAAAFSFAYVSLSAGTGALLLFGAVQATMILWGLRRGERLCVRQLVGLALALIGLVALLFPGLSAPPLTGSILMLGAGVAWGIYSLRGKAAGDAIAATTGNFLRAVPLAALLSIALFPWTHIDRAGTGYAVLSGAIASGLGYVIWYIALPGLKAASAATVQLSAPVLAATGGILLLGEPITLRYLFASIAVLGGIALVVLKRISGLEPAVSNGHGSAARAASRIRFR